MHRERLSPTDSHFSTNRLRVYTEDPDTVVVLGYQGTVAKPGRVQAKAGRVIAKAGRRGSRDGLRDDAHTGAFSVVVLGLATVQQCKTSS